MGENPMSEIKERPNHTDTVQSGTVEYTEGCPGRKEDGRSRAAEGADSASHVRRTR